MRRSHSLYALWLIAMLPLLDGCASARPSDYSSDHFLNDSITRAESGDISAMYRLIEGAAQVEFRPFVGPEYVPYQVSGRVPDNQKKYQWRLSHAERLRWIEAAAEAGDDNMQRVWVLCHQFECLPCNSRQGDWVCADPLVSRDPGKAQSLAARYRQASATPEDWDGMTALLGDMKTLEQRAERGDASAAGRLHQLARESHKLGASADADPLVGIWLPVSRGTAQIHMNREHWRQQWLQLAARLGDQGAREELDPVARQAGQRRRLGEQIDAALQQEKLARRQLLRAATAR